MCYSFDNLVANVMSVGIIDLLKVILEGCSIVAGVAATAVIGGSIIGISQINKKPKNLNIGCVITYGNYNGNSLDWIILDEKDGNYLVQAAHSIDTRSFIDDSNWNYEDDWESTVSWENSDLRTWLNEDFYEEAFTSNERKSIQTSVRDSNSDDADADNSSEETQFRRD